MSTKYPPYVNAYGGLARLFEKIRGASVPPKVTRDYFSTVLGLKSSSFHPMIPFLRRLGFLDANSVPTQRYKDFRSDSKSGFIMAKALKEAYADIYSANEYAHKLQKNELIDVVATLTGASKEDKTIGAIVGTFSELTKFASFDVGDIPEEIGDGSVQDELPLPKNPVGGDKNKTHLGISYTINLNLPPTTEVSVFDAIFKSLKKNILE